VKDVVRTVISGVAGGQGQQFAQLVRDSEKAELVAVVERHNPELAKELATQYGAPDCLVFETIDEAIANVPFQLGISATRPEHHEHEMLALLAAGKCVHCEKPPTDSLPGMRRVVCAERSSDGWVTFNFHLDRQTALVEGNIVRGELGVPRIVVTQWLRCLLSPQEEAAQRSAGLRRGQPAVNPYDDLCHVARASIRLLPPGAKIERVLGHSWGHLETTDATVWFPWDGGWEKAQVIATTGWELAVPGIKTRDLASASVQGSRGHARINFLLDNEFPVGTVIPPEFYARLVRVESDGKLTDALVKSPQPPTPYECMRAKLDEALDRINNGQRPAEPADGGLEVMLLLDALRRSEEENREVEVAAEDLDG